MQPAHLLLRRPSLPIGISPRLPTTQTQTQTQTPSVKLKVKPLQCIGGSFSISDGELESRGFRLRRTAEGLDLEALNTVFARVGFPRREAGRIRLALEHTQAMVWVENGRGRRSGEPVAFARATGDGVFNAVVWDVVVDPSFQGIGLGRAVMERLVADLRSAGLCNIALYAEPRVIAFYRPLGFAADPDGIKGMVYSRNRKQQQQQQQKNNNNKNKG